MFECSLRYCWCIWKMTNYLENNSLDSRVNKTKTCQKMFRFWEMILSGTLNSMRSAESKTLITSSVLWHRRSTRKGRSYKWHRKGGIVLPVTLLASAVHLGWGFSCKLLSRSYISIITLPSDQPYQNNKIHTTLASI